MDSLAYWLLTYPASGRNVEPWDPTPRPPAKEVKNDSPLELHSLIGGGRHDSPPSLWNDGSSC